MSLQVYNKKRNFKATPEPSGKTKKPKSDLSFVVQRHKASHLHYDFRIEINGVLKSWAVPKGPSLNPHDKRLAMMVEDHPYAYKNFAGIIPEDNYGAGIVEIWDEGQVADIDNSERHIAEKKLKAGLHSGNLKFRLYGKKLKGEFALVKLKSKQDNAWLLIKHNDDYATQKPYNSEEHTLQTSPINKWLRENKKPNGLKQKVSIIERVGANSVRKRIGRRSLPKETRKLSTYIKPMLAEEIEKPFNDKNWIYEMKWDGYRAIAEVNGENVSLYSRNGNTFNASYPLVVEELKRLNIHAVLDGEVVVIDKEGKPDFQLLQQYEQDKDHALQYCVFDVLSIYGQDTTDIPLIDRKKLLRQLLAGKNEVVKYSDHIKEKGAAFFKMAGDKKLEGIMAKKANSLYYPGERTSEWLKIKHHKSQEAIIAGFTQPGGTRKYFGALVLGVWEKGELKYIGHTGSGFNQETLKMVSEILHPLIQEHSPFNKKVKTNMPVTWVKPDLVCEVKYTEKTHDGYLRHPIFLRLRDDKKGNEVNQEAIKNLPVKKNKNTEQKEIIKNENEQTLSFGKIKVKITNRNKVFWPKEKITKGDVIDYYLNISKYILPYLKDRPQSLKRNPNGIKDEGFFHKDAGDEAPSWVKSKSIFSESTNKDIHYILCNDQATLTYLNNLGCIEINPWNSTIKALDYPDYLIIDIDPSIKNSFDQVIETANVIYDVLKKAGADCYCKTSGASGIHVYIPTQKKYTYGQLKDFAHIVCILTQQQLPQFTSLERNLAKRGKDMIYLDHLQNRRGQTISSVYSLRPVEGACVSMPLHWKQLKRGISPLDFNIHNAVKVVQKQGDLFSGILGKGIDLKKCLKQLGG